MAFLKRVLRSCTHCNLSGLVASGLVLLSFTLSGQQTEFYTQARRSADEAEALYHSGLFGQAYDTYTQASQMNQPENEPSYQALKRDIQFGQAKSALRMEHPEGQRLMLEFIHETRPDPIANVATMDIANYYFNKSDHEKAITYFATLHSPELSAEMLSEARFKQGYSHFVGKEFTAAETVLGEVREIKTIHYYPVNYYYGMCKFFRQDYDGALVSFEKVAQSEKYREYVPYYITQIHFTRGEYDKVIAYAEPKLTFPGLKNKEDIRLLIGRAHFETGKYAEALPYLEAYAKQAATMSAEDFYQLGFTQYQSGNYSAAIASFVNVASQDNALGQRANFYLADCYLKSGDLKSARTAFRNVSRMEYDEALRTEALLQYGKVSAELKYDADAIQAFDAIPSSSPWRNEAQQALRDLFYRTRDYVTALDALASFPTLSPTLKEAHQQVSLNRGIQLMQDGKMREADAMFAQVQTYPVKADVSAQALFWRAEIAHQQSMYDKSADFLRQYFTLAKTAGQLPVESSPALANYTQGYNYLRQKNYSVAQNHFTEAISLLKQPAAKQYQRNVLPDAMVRAGDCAFKRNLYSEARRHYEDAIPLGGNHMVYAKYQSAMIDGLERKTDAKIRQLEGMVTDHPDSEIADDVLFQLGITYQETGNNSKAMAALQRLLDKYPNSDMTVPALLRLGLVNYNTGNTSAALAHYKRVFKHQPTALEGREALSAIEEIYVSDLKTPDAYFEFVSTVPGYELTAMKKDSVSYRVAEIQYEQADYDNAIKAFSDYLQRFPNGINVTPAYFYRGDAYAIRNQYDEALRDFETVIGRGQSQFYLDALNRSALLSYNHSKDFNASYQHYLRLRDLITDPAKRFDAELGILRSAYRASKLDETFKWSDVVVESPLATDVIRAEGYFYGAKAAFDIKDYDSALGRFNEVIRLSQNAQAAESRYRIAQIYYFNKQLEQAERLCHEANEHNSNYPFWVAKSLILLSDISVEKGDLFNAKAPLEAVIENFQGDEAILEEARQKLDEIYALEQQQSRIRQDTSKSMELQFPDDENKD